MLAPNDEFLTLHSQFSTPVSAGVAQFPFMPPGKYLVFIVDSDLSHEVGVNGRLREALKKQAAAVEIIADEDSRATAQYIKRQTVEDHDRSASLQP